MRQALAAGLLVMLVACGKTADRGDATAAADTGAMAGMPGMGAMMSGAMMDSMTAHMRVMDTASASGLPSMMPMHRQMAANMIAQMNREMGDMKMTADARWTALMDSVRADLVRLPESSGQQLKNLMSAHHGRLTRLMQAHREMTKGMKM
ncbi:MAG: hypothetical protein WD825_12840 [Gemmatimonadaceae bacterium]